MSEATFEQLRAVDAILFGAIGDPRVPDVGYAATVLLRLRFELDLYVNLRPAKLYDDRLSPLRREQKRKVDLLIVRENTEGLYVGMGGRFKQGTEHEVAIQEDLNTYLGVTRIVDYAFQVASREVVMVDKSNDMAHAGGLWQQQWKAVAANVGDRAALGGRPRPLLVSVAGPPETDLDLLYRCIEPSLPSREFFLRKAIGWALRSYAWTDPREIVRYVRAHESELSPLSKREALKNVTSPSRTDRAHRRSASIQPGCRHCCG